MYFYENSKDFLSYQITQIIPLSLQEDEKYSYLKSF